MTDPGSPATGDPRPATGAVAEAIGKVCGTLPEMSDAVSERRRRPGVDRLTRFARSLPDRPVLATLLIGLVFTVLQTWWIAKHRQLGAFNVDEEGGLAAALRFHRSVGLDPRALITEVFSTWNGPLVPLLAVPIIIAGPHAIATVMVIQPLLVVAAACGTAGIVANTNFSRRAALLAGVMTMLLPISVVSSRSFQYSTGVAAFLALSLWGLLASDRGRRRWPMIGFGAATGAMLLCRTMSASFLPAIAVAALVVVARERRAWINVIVAAVTTLVVAGLWWAVEWNDIIKYLTENASTIGYTVAITIIDENSWSYHEDTTLKMKEFPEPFAHTDHNTLHRKA